MKNYDEILNSMKEEYKNLTGTDAENASDLGIRFAVLAGEIFSCRTELAWLKNQMFPNTATGEYLDLHAAERGLSRKSGSKAEGFITFWTNGVAYDIDIPKGTVCATSGSNSVRYVTTEDAVLISGRTFVPVPAEAVSEGALSNVRSGKVTVMVTPITGISYITNSPFTGGSDAESDEQLRARIIDSFKNISNGTNKAFYVKSAMSVKGVTAVGVVPRNRGAGTVDVFITDENGNPSAELIQTVQNTLDELREVNVDIQVKALNLYYMSIYFEFTCKKGYNIDTVKSECETAVREYFKGLSAGETMYVSDLGEYVQHVEGVKNYTFSDYVTNTSVPENYIVFPNRIVITGVQES